MILGIELGSTRIKAVLLNRDGKIAAVSSYEWKDSLIDGLWSYSLDDVKKGLQTCYADLKKTYEKTSRQKLTTLAYCGISAMMHGYLVFDKEGRQLVPFRTWRNTNTAEAAKELSEALQFNMPIRWSAAHFYQAVLNGESHVKNVSYMTTLSGYVHTLLTGEKVLGIGDASGMFPVSNGDFDKEKLKRYQTLLQKHGISTDFASILPTVKTAGEKAGVLTKEGALLLDPTGDLQPGACFCPPEGDAQTGMVATNSVKVRTGNVSAGTSAFVMVVLEKALRRVYPEIDITATPSGDPVAMVHANTCTSDINAWMSLFHEVLQVMGQEADKGDLFTNLFLKADESDSTVGDLYTCNFYAGEPILKVDGGRPMVLRSPNSRFTLANFMQAEIYAAVAPLYFGMELLKEEHVEIDGICGHGGYFKTPGIGQKAMSLALQAPVTVYKNAGEGGAFGIALLALYALMENTSHTPLAAFLDRIYQDAEKVTLEASPEEKAKFAHFIQNYQKGTAVEKAAVTLY